jgi:hypothetical protein
MNASTRDWRIISPPGLTAAICIAAVVGLASGCSFIFDFDECESHADCVQFDKPLQGEFYACSNANKCVLDVERRCRVDSHCAQSGQVCEQETGRCVQPS